MPDQPREFPPVVYLPLAAASDGVDHVEYQVLLDGRRCLFAYSAIDRLQDMYHSERWVLVSVEGLEKLQQNSPFEVIVLDQTPAPTAQETGVDQ
ncbi:MAG: hypothetical protein ACRDPH_04055 [Marmoricola sp.]